MAKIAFDFNMIKTKDDIIKVVNECGLPYSALIYMLADIQNALQNELNKVIPQQKEAYEQELIKEAEELQKGD